MIQKIKSENNRNGRDHLTLFRWPLLPFFNAYTVPGGSFRLRAMGALSQVKVLNMPR